MANKDAVAKWRKKNIQSGKCRFCRRRAKKGRTMCAYHLDYFKWRKRLGMAKAKQ